MSNKKVIAGIDIGNGYVKGRLNYSTATDVDMPSAIVLNNLPKDVLEPDIEDEVNNIHNRMDATFNSPMLIINDDTRFLIGERAVNIGQDVEEFNAVDGQSKSMNELTNILTFACIAGKVVQDYWHDNHSFPKEPIEVDVRVAVALPITEYMEHRAAFAKRYMEGKHTVTIHNFETPIVVVIHFEDVQVVAEGQAAQRAIIAKGVQYMEALLNEAKEHGTDVSEFTPDLVLHSNNTIGIDIGEGTVNFPVYTDGKFNPDVSYAINVGYGKVLDNSIKMIAEKNIGMVFDSRKQLQKYLMAGPKAKKALYEEVSNVVNENILQFAKQINREYAKLARRIGALNDVVYVYGGGATALKYDLYPMLANTSSQFGKSLVIYFDAVNCQKLNREGLYVIADAYAKVIAARAAKVAAK